MPKISGNSSPLERKLRELAKEEERVRKELKNLSKALKKGEPLPTPPVPKQTRVSTPKTESSAPDNEPSSKTRVYQDERFANYFTTGGFKSAVPLRRDAKVQRNKAIFMIVLIVLLGYILYAMLT